MKKIIASLILFFVAGLSFAQTSEGPNLVQENKANDNQTSKALEQTEQVLNERILTLNKSFQIHSKILLVKLKTLPGNTVSYKGKAKGDLCEVSTNQEDPSNNCLVVESFDFIGSETGRQQGDRNKSVTLFFEDDAANNNDPRTAPPRKLLKMKSRMFQYNQIQKDRLVLEIVDNDPVNTPAHDDKITVILQHDNDPIMNTPETPSNRGYGKYKLADVENTKTNPLRNQMKKDAYLKHLEQFHKQFSKIYDFNDGKSNKSIKGNIEFFKKTLQY